MIEPLPPDVAILAALLVGHTTADFLLQPRWMVENKHRPSVLLVHGLLVAAIQGGTLAPLVGWDAALVGLGIGAVHTLVDAGKLKAGAWTEKNNRRTAAFLADQILHLAALVAAWVVLRQDHAPIGGAVDLYTWIALIFAGLLANGIGGMALVRSLLADLRLSGQDVDEARAAHGRIIGVLERWLIFLLVLWGTWSAIGLVVAAKSIARFKDMDDQGFAEVYLVGTLASVLVAVVTGSFVAWMLPG